MASIVVGNMKKLLWELLNLKNRWKSSSLDATLWFISFATCVLLELEYGLVAGVATAILILIFRGQHPKTALLGSLPNTNHFVDIENYPNVSLTDTTASLKKP